MPEIPKLTHVQALAAYKLKLTYRDGTIGTVDLSHLAKKGVFRLWDKEGEAHFSQASLGDFAEVRWGELLDMCGDALYLQSLAVKEALA